MNVKELIEKLKLYDPELPVCFSYGDDGEEYRPARSVCATQPMEHDKSEDTLMEIDDDNPDLDTANYLAIEH